MRTVVVYVHGLWFGGGESLLLRRRLARALEAECRVFAYPSVGGTVDSSTVALRRYLAAIDADTVHLVAHSMGGLLILRMFDPPGPPVFPPGRIVLTGSPVRGSHSAAKFARWPLGRTLLGLTAMEVLAAPLDRRWAGTRELGVIAGNLNVGLGRVLGRLPGPNDGTVMVSETDLPGAAAQLQLPVSHTGLVLSAEVARQVAAFLRDGRFGPLHKRVHVGSLLS